jgi:hypothetical protein
MNIRAKIFGGSGAFEEEPILKSKTPKGAKADDLHSVAVPREEKRRADTRKQDRHRFVDEHARATHKGATHDVQLVNVSGGGAMISAAFDVHPWDRVDLHLGDHGTIECAVLWVKDGRVGLEFEHETRLDCSADEQAELLRDVIKRNFPEVVFNGRRKDDAAADGEPPMASDPAEHRSERRHPLIWSGVLHYDYESRPVRLRNISSMGATIETDIGIAPGAEPLLDLGDAGTVFGTVAWTVGDQIGLRFKEPFDVSALARSRPKVAPVKWQPPKHISQHMHSDSPVQHHWDRLSLSELQEALDGFMKR